MNITPHSAKSPQSLRLVGRPLRALRVRRTWRYVLRPGPSAARPLRRHAQHPSRVPACRRHKVLSRRCAQTLRQLPPAPARPGVMACGLALRCSFPAGHARLPRPPPRGLPIPGLQRALLRRLRHSRQAAAPQANGNAKARSASGASRHVALHRMRKRIASVRRQDQALRALRGLDGASVESARKKAAFYARLINKSVGNGAHALTKGKT